VHSEREVGFDSANTIGRSFIWVIVSMTSRVNVFGVAPTPMIAVGFNALTAPRKSPTGACACA